MLCHAAYAHGRFFLGKLPAISLQLSLSAGLGVKLVIVLGVQPQIDALLEERGHEPKYMGGYRITDEHAMLAAMQAAGSARMEVEAQLSKVCRLSAIMAAECVAV